MRDEERDGKTVATFLVDSADALLHIVNLGCIPLHVLACQKDALELCEFLTIDFDLGGQPLHQGVKLALSLRELLAELGLVGYPKTSGQSGLHVFIPLGPGVSFDTAKALFVEGNPQAAMQAFMSGQIKVEGDMTKLMAMQGGGMAAPSEEQKAFQDKIQALTA